MQVENNTMRTSDGLMLALYGSVVHAIAVSV